MLVECNLKCIEKELFFQPSGYINSDIPEELQGEFVEVLYKVATQLGTTMEIWLKANMPDAKLVVMDTSNCEEVL